jgi:hypothetical protein
MMPMVMVAPRAIVADAARAVMGQDHPAAAVRIIIGVIVIRVIGRAIEEAPVKVVVVREAIAAVAKAAGTIAAAVEDWSGAKPAAMEYGAGAVKAAAVKTSAAMEATTAVEASAATAVRTASTSAMSTSDFHRQPAGGSFRRGRSARIDRRERFGALRNG